MKILAIETSCDETAIAIAEFSGSKKKPRVNILSNIVSSQVKLHAKYGGVVPHLAKREHQKNLSLVLLRALMEGGISTSSYDRVSKQNLKFAQVKKILERESELLKHFEKKIFPLKPPAIDAIAVTNGPGLAPALWVGVNFAKALSVLWNRPLIPISHMAGHLYSAFLQKSEENSKFEIRNSKFPAIALLVSGGHTELVLVKGHGKFKMIGETLDDAAGEAFDKVARILGLGYPGGPQISALAETSQTNAEGRRKSASIQSQRMSALRLPRPMLNSGDFNFSFSGLKTAALYAWRDMPHTKEAKISLAREFQNAAVDVLVKKTIAAAKNFKVKTILLGGGVAANKMLREKLAKSAERELPFTICKLPTVSLTGDNALMIAIAAFFTGKKKAWNKVQADANLRL